MTRFYFNVVTDGETIIDQDGLEFPSLADAIAEGRSSAREVLAGSIRSDTTPPVAISIRDGDDQEVANVPLKSLLPKSLL